MKRRPPVETDLPEDTSSSDSDAAPPARKASRQQKPTRVLVFASRGINSRDRHLLNDMRDKKDVKLDSKDRLDTVNEVCELRSCNATIFFEVRKRNDVYMWVSSVPQGPSVKFLVTNVHTMSELRMTGNCLKGSRPIISFGAEFEAKPEWQLIKSLFSRVFATPDHHPKSKPFVDHVISFHILDNRIWMRHYQIAPDELIEIGPRFVLAPIRIFSGSMGGPTLWENPHFVSPNAVRSQLRHSKQDRYAGRVRSKHERVVRHDDNILGSDPLASVFE